MILSPRCRFKFYDDDCIEAPARLRRAVREVVLLRLRVSKHSKYGVSAFVLVGRSGAAALGFRMQGRPPSFEGGNQ